MKRNQTLGGVFRKASSNIAADYDSDFVIVGPSLFTSIQTKKGKERIRRWEKEGERF